jgi:O-antigen ligase/tetratricopeptide (TPR) repeat protein
MPNNTESGREHAIHNERARPKWITFAVALLPVLACFLGGTTEKWAEGIVVAALGLLLIVDPPRHSLGRWINGIFIALVVCAAISFLPANWFLQPSWRAALTNDFGIKLPATLSPQPWITLGCFISFAAGLSWFYYVCAQEFEMRDVRLQVRIFALGIVFLAGISILLHMKGTAIPFWHNQRGFGPFPNRNQTGDLFGITAIMLLASGQDHFRRGKSQWILSALGFVILVAALILNFSRAGILILVGGSAIWLTIMAVRQASLARMAVGLSAVLVLLTTLLIFGGPTLERFQLRGGAADGIASDFRWLIFRDTWRLIWSSPWCGIGLGNFEPIFAISRIASVADTRSLHPESDWLWLWTELGWPGVMLILFGIALIIPHVFPLREGTNQRIRLAALIAAIVFALHGLFDVSAHRIGTAFAGIFLFGSALHRPFQCRYSRVLPILFRAVGLILLVTGLTWSAAWRYHWPIPGSLGAGNLRRAATIMYRSRSFDEAITLTNRGLDWAPLDWRLYFLRARAKIEARRNRANAIADFQRARFLEPNGYEVPFQEGMFWLSRREPILAITAWREALHRAGPRRSEIYGEMFFNSPPDARFLGELTALAANDAELIIVGLDRLERERFPFVLSKFLESDRDLRGFGPEQKKKLLLLWAERGNLEEFARAVEAHPEWRDAAWQGMAKYYASKGNFRAAAELALQFATPPVLPSPNESTSLESLQQAFYADSNNFSVGCALHREQMRQRKFDDALATARHFTALSGAPTYFYFLEAQSWAAKENWERAWNAWLAFQRASKK